MYLFGPITRADEQGVNTTLQCDHDHLLHLIEVPRATAASLLLTYFSNDQAPCQHPPRWIAVVALEESGVRMNQ